MVNKAKFRVVSKEEDGSLAVLHECRSTRFLLARLEADGFVARNIDLVGRREFLLECPASHGPSEHEAAFILKATGDVLGYTTAAARTT